MRKNQLEIQARQEMQKKEKAVLDLFKAENAIVKTMRSTQGNNAWWESHLNQLANPGTTRTLYHQRTDVHENVRFNPLTGKEETYIRTNERGVNKNTAYIKKTDVTLSSKDAHTSFYGGPPDETQGNYNIGLIYDLEGVDPSKPLKYAFFEFKNTNARNWQKPLDPNSATAKDYWGATPARNIAWRIHEIRERNEEKEWCTNALMVCLSRASVRGIGVIINAECDRINATHKQQLSKKILGIDVPVVIFPQKGKLNSFLRIYHPIQQYCDILRVQSRTDNSPGATAAKAFLQDIDINRVRQTAMGSILNDDFDFSSPYDLKTVVSLFMQSGTSDDINLLALLSFHKPALLNDSAATLAHFAVKNDQIELTMELAASEWCINARDTSNRTALMEAIRIGNRDQHVDYILQNAAEKLDETQCRDVLTQLISINDLTHAELLLEKNTRFSIEDLSLILNHGLYKFRTDQFDQVKAALLCVVTDEKTAPTQKCFIEKLLARFTMEIAIRTMSRQEEKDRSEIVLDENNVFDEIVGRSEAEFEEEYLRSELLSHYRQTLFPKLKQSKSAVIALIKDKLSTITASVAQTEAKIILDILENPKMTIENLRTAAVAVTQIDVLESISENSSQETESNQIRELCKKIVNTAFYSENSIAALSDFVNNAFLTQPHEHAPRFESI